MTLDVHAGLFGDDLDAVALALDALVPPMCPSELLGDSKEGRPHATDAG